MLSAQVGEPHFSVHASFKVQLKGHFFYDIFLNTRLEFIAPSSGPPGHFAGVSFTALSAVIKCLFVPLLSQKERRSGGGGSLEKMDGHLTPLSCSSKPWVAWPQPSHLALACLSNHVCAGPPCFTHRVASAWVAEGWRTLLQRSAPAAPLG